MKQGEINVEKKFFFFLLFSLKEKRSANILRHLESCHVASKSSSFQVFSFIKCYRRCANGSRSIVQRSKTAEENEENTMKLLNVLLNRQKIK